MDWIIISIFIFIGCNNKKPDIIFKTDVTEIELTVGEYYTPELIIENIENYELEYTYDDTIISIDDNKIYCISAGYCEVIISIKNVDVEAIILYIDVIEVIPEKIICEEEILVYIGNTYQLNISFEPENSTPFVIYSVMLEDIASVDENGLVTAKKVGETYIVIKSELSNNVRTRVLVKVEKEPVEKIEVIDKVNLTYGESYQIDYSVYPQNSEQEVIFESLDPSIASVDENGLILGIKYGVTNIKVISITNSDIYSTIEVSVDGDKANDINISNDNIIIDLGEEYLIEYSVNPSTAYQKVEIISNNNEGIEIIDNVIIGIKVGNYKITLKTIDGTNIEKTINIEVKGNEEPIFVTNSIFDKQSTLSWNEQFNPLDNIKAYDNIDGDVTNNIVVKGEVDNRRYGEYVLEYYIKDSNGNTNTLVRTINVIWGYDVTVIGHAGSYYGVPNSEEAILYAAEVLKYPAIEIDLKQTKDGVFVLSHDPQWGSASLENLTYEELKDVEYTVTKNAGVVEGGLSEKQRTFTAKICTFERYLEICKQYNIIAIVELKTSTGISNWTESNAPHASKMPLIMELIKKYDMLDRVVFLTNQELCLNWVKTNGYDYIPCQYLTLSSCENENTYNIVKKYKLDISFNVRDGIKISDEWLNKYRELGCKLAVFTFEEYASYNDIQTWIDRGVDYVTTDWHVLDKLNLPKSNE